MNLDSLSFALAEISYSVANLTKKNFKSSVGEISHVCIFNSLCLNMFTFNLGQILSFPFRTKENGIEVIRKRK